LKTAGERPAEGERGERGCLPNKWGLDGWEKGGSGTVWGSKNMKLNCKGGASPYRRRDHAEELMRIKRQIPKIL